ncbi:Hypothetical predicted protein [Scomber scombrus]|uniref:Uncharacterized protein n=1 Tax=Scomber scombrus TaxID=13677 RepID=A0AAV1Q1F3_SCOSC
MAEPSPSLIRPTGSRGQKAPVKAGGARSEGEKHPPPPPPPLRAGTSVSAALLAAATDSDTSRWKARWER